MLIYLYVKTHLITGLRYLGQTTSKDPHKYPGSGLYWRQHLNKHGYNYSTEIIKECNSKEELKLWGSYYSQLWNIVESNDWANLKIESGDGGIMPAESYIKAKNTKKKNGYKRLPTSIRKAIETRRRNGWTISDDTKRKMSESKKGKKHTENTCAKIRKNRKGKGKGKRHPHSETTKKKLSMLNKGKQRSKESVQKQLETKIKNGNLCHTEETKLKMRKPKPEGFREKLARAHAEGRHAGSANRTWITNGVESRRIKIEDPIPKGWYKGCTTTSVPPSQKGKFWITNGIISTMSNDIPPGWHRGRKIKTQDI